MTVVTNAEDFSVALDQFYEKRVKTAVVEAQKEVVRLTFRSLVSASPQWTGRYVGSINVALGSPNTFILPEHPEVESGSLHWPVPPRIPYLPSSEAEVEEELTGLTEFGVVYLSESVPYAIQIEDGHSSQAPLGVFNPVAARMGAIFDHYDWMAVLK